MVKRTSGGKGAANKVGFKAPVKRMNDEFPSSDEEEVNVTIASDEDVRPRFPFV